MAAIEKMSLTGKYGEVIQVHPLQHPPQIVVKLEVKSRDDFHLMELRLYYAFVNFGLFKDDFVQLFLDIAEQVDMCLATDGFQSPKAKRSEWMQIGFTQEFADKHLWTYPPKVIA